MWEEHEENLRYIKAVSFPEEINQSSRSKCVVPVTLGEGGGTCLPHSQALFYGSEIIHNKTWMPRNRSK